MPTDVSLDVASRPARAFGVGLTLGACVSIALWTFIGLGVRALTA